MHDQDIACDCVRTHCVWSTMSAVSISTYSVLSLFFCLIFTSLLNMLWLFFFFSSKLNAKYNSINSVFFPYHSLDTQRAHTHTVWHKVVAIIRCHTIALSHNSIEGFWIFLFSSTNTVLSVCITIETPKSKACDGPFHHIVYCDIDSRNTFSLTFHISFSDYVSALKTCLVIQFHLNVSLVTCVRTLKTIYC